MNGSLHFVIVRRKVRIAFCNVLELSGIPMSCPSIKFYGDTTLFTTPYVSTDASLE